MASIFERKTKNRVAYYLRERINHTVKLTYLGTKPPLAKSRGWTNLSPDIIEWLKQRAQQKTKPVKINSEHNGKYRTIVIDPPWPMERINRMCAGGAGGEIPFDYPTMTLSDIKGNRKLLPIRRLADKSGCFVFLWTTQKFMPLSFDILAVWGFRYIFTMVWDKGHGMKPYNLPLFNCEFILVGKRGEINFIDTKDFRTLFNGDRRNHSQKPVTFYDLLRRVAPEPRIDMFSREQHDGFEQWGNETDKFINN